MTPDELKNKISLRIEPVFNAPNSLVYFEPHYVDLPVNEHCFRKVNFLSKKGMVIEGTISPQL